MIVVRDGAGAADTLIGCFSLVAYLPEPLASFIGDLRKQLEAGCDIRGHLTILPPQKPVPAVTREQAWERIQSVLSNRGPFRVELTEVNLFDVSGVVHLSIGEGARELKQLHGSLARAFFNCTERYVYEPHVTLAHLGRGRPTAAALSKAERQWREYRKRRSFLVEELTLVQCTAEQCWDDLYHTTLRAPVGCLVT